MQTLETFSWKIINALITLMPMRKKNDITVNDFMEYYAEESTEQHAEQSHGIICALSYGKFK